MITILHTQSIPTPMNYPSLASPSKMALWDAAIKNM